PQPLPVYPPLLGVGDLADVFDQRMTELGPDFPLEVLAIRPIDLGRHDQRQPGALGHRDREIRPLLRRHAAEEDEIASSATRRDGGDLLPPQALVAPP